MIDTMHLILVLSDFYIVHKQQGHVGTDVIVLNNCMQRNSLDYLPVSQITINQKDLMNLKQTVLQQGVRGM